MSKQPPKTSSEGSNVIELRKQLEKLPASAKKADITAKLEEVSDFCILQAKQLEDLQRKLDEKDHKIAHLEQLLKGATPVIGVATQITDEDEIIAKQLQFLRNIGKNRPFTTDEARIFDILTKNKRINEAGKETIDVNSEKINKLSKPDLLKLASNRKK